LSLGVLQPQSVDKWIAKVLIEDVGANTTTTQEYNNANDYVENSIIFLLGFFSDWGHLFVHDFFSFVD